MNAFRNEQETKFYITRLYELESKVQFHPKQLEVKKAIFEQGFKKIFCRKGRKAGGTEITLYPAFRICGTQRNKLAYLIYPDSPTAERILHQTNRLKNYAPKEWNIEYTWTDKKREVRFPLTDSLLVILGAHQWESMQGFEADMFGFDELADHDPRAYQYCYPNIAARNALWMVTGAPPLDQKNYYNAIENEAKSAPDVWSFHKWNFRDNTFLPPEYLASAEREKELAILRGEEDIWEVQMEANHVKTSRRTVLPCFDSDKHAAIQAVHLRAIQGHKITYLVAFDPGYAVCFAAGFFAFDHNERKLYLLAEIYEKDRRKASARQIWERYATITNTIAPPGTRWINLYDSAATGFAVEVRDLEVNRLSPPIMLPTIKQKDDEDKYFRMINNLCLDDRFFVASECRHAIDEIESYMTTEQGHYPDANNHILDIIRYAVKWFEKNIAGFAPNSDNIGAPIYDPTQQARFDLWRTPQKTSPNDWPFLG